MSAAYFEPFPLGSVDYELAFSYYLAGGGVHARAQLKIGELARFQTQLESVYSDLIAKLDKESQVDVVLTSGRKITITKNLTH